MSTPTDRAAATDHVRDLGRYNAEHDPRTPPGEAFPPYMGLVGEENPNAAWARFAHEQSGLAMDIRGYIGMLAQRAAPINEQIYEGGGTLLNGAPIDISLGQIPVNLLTARVHRLVVEGTAADVVTVSLYADGAALGSALATWNLGALNADGVAMVEPRDLHFPKGRRIIARVRAGVSVNPIYVKAFTRSYPA